MAIEDIKDLAERIPSLQPMLDDEAKTKQFLILPLIRALGYDDCKTCSRCWMMRQKQNSF